MRLNALPFVAALMLGGPAGAQSEAARHHAEALALFDTACLTTLPGFEAADAVFRDEGLEAGEGGLWVDTARGFIARTTREEGDRQRGCMVALSQADVGALNSVLGQALGAALQEEEVGVIRGPLPGNPSLFVVDRTGYRITAVVAEVSQGYAMLTVGTQVAPGAAPPWNAP